MDDGLKKYLAKRKTTLLDTSILEEYATLMTATVIPEIVRNIDRRELLAAELRVLPPVTSRSKKEPG